MPNNTMKNLLLATALITSLVSTATAGDMELSLRGASGFIMMELRKDENWGS